MALAVSCRDAYLDAVDPDERERGQFVCREHPGFAGREVRAAHKYFAHYQLETPRIPLVLPEFSIPLFLQLYCESLRDRGLSAPPDHHESRSEIFERFLETKSKRVVARLAPNAGAFRRQIVTDDVAEVLQRFLLDLVKSGREGVAREAFIRELLAMQTSSGIDPVEVIDAMISEGLITQERIYLEGRFVEGLRVTFQAFADFLILRRRMNSRGQEQLLGDDEFRVWLRSASNGIIEAAAIVLPERYGVELSEYLLPDGSIPQEEGPHQAQTLYLQRVLLETLPYRSAKSVTDDTVRLINEGLRKGVHRPEDLYDIAFALASQPDHPLNAHRLHRHLSRLKMPDRDAWFGKATYFALADDSSAAARLARWAAEGPHSQCAPDVIELAAIPLVWLLSSPNRFMRDWVTKALVQLLAGNASVILRLLEHFKDVDDPYVWERLVTITYGAALRSAPPDIRHMDGPARWILHNVFSPQGGEIAADALMLDSARGLVAWARRHNLIDAHEAAGVERRLGIAPPGPAWSLTTIEKRFHDPKGKLGGPGEGYSSIYWSLFSMGDFGRYVVESGLRHFSRFSLDGDPPTKQHWEVGAREPTKKGWDKFVRSLNPSQLDFLLRAGDEPDETKRGAAATRLIESLSEGQHALYSSMWPKPRRRRLQLTEYDTERARRWIFQRVIRLGWTPDRFGWFDHHRSRGDGRSAHKVERFGKKYQWIAYHELLARVMDNFHIDPMYEEYRPLDGIYQIGDREIDPTLPPIAFDDFVDGTRGPHLSPSRLSIHVDALAHLRPPYHSYGDDLAIFLADTTSLPLAERFAVVTDSAQEEWVVLDGSLPSRMGPDPEDDEATGPLEQSCWVSSWFVEAASLPHVLRRVEEELANSWSDLEQRNGHTNCCYLGELAWRTSECPYQFAAPIELHRSSSAPIRLYKTAEHYSWEGSGFDCSINQTVALSTPAHFMHAVGQIEWSRSGPEWDARDGVTIAFIGERDWNATWALVARRGWLLDFLASREIALITQATGERRRLQGRDTYAQPYLEYSSLAALDASGAIRARRTKIHPHASRGQ